MEEKTGYYFKSENDTQSYYFINFTEINNKQNGSFQTLGLASAFVHW